MPVRMRSLVLQLFAIAWTFLAGGAAFLALELARHHHATRTLLDTALMAVPMAAALGFISRKEVIEITVKVRPLTFEASLEPATRTIARVLGWQAVYAALLAVLALTGTSAAGILLGFSAWTFSRAVRLRALERRTGRRLLRPNGRRQDEPGAVYAV